MTAAISGMTGLGGGTILVAVMFAVGLVPAVAVPVHAVVQLVSNGARTIAFLRHVDFKALGVFLVGAVPAPFLVAGHVTALDPRAVRVLMGVFILEMVWTTWLRRVRVEGPAGLVIAGALAGGVGMVVGATGTLIAPFFLKERWSKETIIGTKALCQGAAHVLKVVAFTGYGFAFSDQAGLILPMGVAVVAGTWLGKTMGNRIGERTFRWVYRAILTVLAVKLILL